MDLCYLIKPADDNDDDDNVVLIKCFMSSLANRPPEAYSTEVVRSWLYIFMCACL